MNEKVCQVINDRILELLAKGTVPWRKPWRVTRPQNLISRKPYRGVNVFVLSAMAMPSPYWLTYNQAKGLGGNVRKGEHGTPVVFWKFLERERENDAGKIAEREIPMLRYYTVFNVTQTEGIEFPQDVAPVNPIESADKIITGYANPPKIEHGGDRAFYLPPSDLVQMPERTRFETSEAYYQTMFHELVHSTGHSSRLARPGVVDKINFGSEPYAKEELVAEMGAAYLCGDCGFENRVESSAAYIDAWREKLTKEPKLIISAGSQAQKACDCILGQSQAPAPSTSA